MLLVNKKGKNSRGRNVVGIAERGDFHAGGDQEQARVLTKILTARPKKSRDQKSIKGKIDHNEGRRAHHARGRTNPKFVTIAQVLHDDH